MNKVIVDLGMLDPDLGLTIDQIKQIQSLVGMDKWQELNSAGYLILPSSRLLKKLQVHGTDANHAI